MRCRVGLRVGRKHSRNFTDDTVERGLVKLRKVSVMMLLSSSRLPLISQPQQASIAMGWIVKLVLIFASAFAIVRLTIVGALDPFFSPTKC